MREGHQRDHEQGERHDQPAVGMAGPAAPPSGGGDHRAEREPGRDAEQPFQVGEAAGDDQGERGIPDEQRAKPEPPSWGQRRGGGRRCTEKGGRHAQVAVVREAGGPVPPVPGSAEDQGHRSPDGDEVDDQAGHERASRTEAPLGEPATQHDAQQERHIGDRVVREEGAGDEAPPVTRVHARRSVPHRVGERLTGKGGPQRAARRPEHEDGDRQRRGDGQAAARCARGSPTEGEGGGHISQRGAPNPLIRPRQPGRSDLVVVALGLAQTLVDLLADRADRELVGVSSRDPDLAAERHVAIKLMHREIARDSDQLERFRREARAVAQLSHPHIVGVIDAGEEDDGTPYIVFEYVEGETLKDRIRRMGRLPVDEAVAYAIEIARGARRAHERDIVHRDVKPQNVLIDERGLAKVTDFGIARSLDDEGLTADGRVLGTTDYVSPEQALGHEVTAQSDIYSLGVVLYEMLTGDVPFHGENQVAVAMKHVREDLPDVQARRPEVSARSRRSSTARPPRTSRERYADAGGLISRPRGRARDRGRAHGQTTGEATPSSHAARARKRRRLPGRVVHPARWIAGSPC